MTKVALIFLSVTLFLAALSIHQENTRLKHRIDLMGERMLGMYSKDEAAALVSYFYDQGREDIVLEKIK